MMRFVRIFGLIILVSFMANLVFANDLDPIQSPYQKAMMLVTLAKEDLSSQEYSNIKHSIYSAYEQKDQVKLDAVMKKLTPYLGKLSTYTNDAQVAQAKMAPQIVGGPDAYGYIMVDNQTGGPDYPYDDCTSGNQVLYSVDEAWTSVMLPFTFTFYGTPYNNVNILSNGAVTFGGACDDFQAWKDQCYWGDFGLPLTPMHWFYCPDGLVTPALIDLDFVNVYWRVFGVSGDQDYRITFQWQGSHFEWGGFVDFEVSLYDDGRIVIQYNAINQPFYFDHGRYWQVGIQAQPFGVLGYLQYQDCGDANLDAGLDITFLIPQPINCDLSSEIIGPIAGLDILPVNTIAPLAATFYNNGTDDQYDVPVFYSIYTETGNLLVSYDEVIPYIPSLGQISVLFGNYQITERERRIVVKAWHELPCDYLMAFGNVGDYYYVNNFAEQVIYMHNEVTNDKCPNAKELVLRHWYEMHNFGAENDADFNGIGLPEPTADVWFKVTNPGNGILTIDFVRPSQEPAISISDMYFTATITPSEFFTDCDLPMFMQIRPDAGWSIAQYCDPNREELDIRLLPGQTLYFVLQSIGMWAPEHFFYKVRATFYPFRASPDYHGNETCINAEFVPDNLATWYTEGSTFGATNNFWTQIWPNYPMGTCFGWLQTGFWGFYSDMSRGPDVVYQVPLYEGYGGEFELGPGPSSCRIMDYSMTLMQGCHQGNIQDWCLNGTRNPEVMNWVAVDDNDWWPEERVDYYVVIDGVNWDPYSILDCQPGEGDFEFKVRKPLPCTYDEGIEPRLQIDYDYILTGQTLMLRDQSFLAGCKNNGGQDNRVWFMITPKELRDHFEYLQPMNPDWYGIQIDGNEQVWMSPNDTIYESGDTLFVTKQFILDYGVTERAMIFFGPFEESQAVRYTFDQDMFVILGISCRDCPGYAYDVKRVTVVPDNPNPWINCMILDDQKQDIGARIDIALGETILLNGWGECLVQEDPKKLRYDWYLNTRDGVGPMWSDHEFITYTAPMGITRIILAVTCLDDPIEGYIEAFDTVTIVASKAKTPISVDELVAGEIKLDKPKFVGGVENLSLAYKAVNLNAVSTLSIFDMRGRLVAKVNGNSNADIHNFTWNGMDTNGNLLPAGTYVWKLENGSETKSGVTVLTR